MGALFVVGCHPFVDDLADFAEGGEHVRIKDLAPEGPVEACCVGLPGLMQWSPTLWASAQATTFAE